MPQRSKSREKRRRDDNDSKYNGSGPSSGPSWAAYNKLKERTESAEGKVHSIEEDKKKKDDDQTLSTKITTAIQATLRMAGITSAGIPAPEEAPRPGPSMPPFMLTGSPGAGAGA